MAVEDEVFEEEESAESEGDSARLMPLRGRRIQTRRAFRQAVPRCPEAEERAKQRNSP